MKARVLHILPDLVPYGLERMVASLALCADRSRFDVSVASLYGLLPGSLAPDLESEGIRVFHLDKKRGLDIRMFPRLSRLFATERPDILHTHNYVLRYVLPPAMLHGVQRIVHTIHNVADREVDRLGVMLQKGVFRNGRVQPVVIAEQGAITYERTYALPRPPLIRNGIPVARFRLAPTERQRWRAANGFGDDSLLFVCVARFMEQKNHKTLLQAFADGPSKNPSSVLLLAGDGELRAELEAQSKSLGISGRVRFLGRRDDVPELLAAADVFVLASLWEGNPLSVMEAMSAGLPAVVTAVGGVPELVEHGREGLVVPPGQAAPLAEAMNRLAENAQERLSMGRAASQRAAADFSEEEMVNRYQALYSELLREKISPGLCPAGEK